MIWCLSAQNLLGKIFMYGTEESENSLTTSAWAFLMHRVNIIGSLLYWPYIWSASLVKERINDPSTVYWTPTNTGGKERPSLSNGINKVLSFFPSIQSPSVGAYFWPASSPIYFKWVTLFSVSPIEDWMQYNCTYPLMKTTQCPLFFSSLKFLWT